MPQNWLPGMEAEQRKLDLSQWYTPPETAARLAQWAQGEARILEPAVGRGALVMALMREHGRSRVLMYDADPTNVEHLSYLEEFRACEVRCGDFLAAEPDEQFDVAVMNPPYENDQDVDFVLRALDWAPRVIGIFRSAIVHGIDRREQLWSKVKLTRLAWMSGRPRFGGAGAPLSDFVALEVVGLKDGERFSMPFEVNCEWW